MGIHRSGLSENEIIVKAKINKKEVPSPKEFTYINPRLDLLFQGFCYSECLVLFSHRVSFDFVTLFLKEKVVATGSE